MNERRFYAISACGREYKTFPTIVERDRALAELCGWRKCGYETVRKYVERDDDPNTQTMTDEHRLELAIGRFIERHRISSRAAFDIMYTAGIETASNGSWNYVFTPRAQR